jgi:SAM-dependent methyltransferase
MDEVLALLDKSEFPRSSRYEVDWMLDNQMGPNALWLVEWLSQALPLKREMRVLDLGCGRGMTSIFLAKEFDVRVWSTDLWIGPDSNWRRAQEAGVADRVCPMRCEAHALPFARGFFDAVVSVDAYHYFGTNDLYLNYLAGFVRPGGSIGVVVPGLTRPLEGEVPPHLLEPQQNGKRFWEDDCVCFHTAEWWRALWSQSGKVEQVSAQILPDGWRHWMDFERALELSGKNIFPSDAEALERDAGSTIGLVRAMAVRNEAETINIYDPAIGVRFGVDA